MEGKRLICNYNPKEAGEYQIKIMWNRDHIYGSPFIVFKGDTKQQLADCQRAQSINLGDLKIFYDFEACRKGKKVL